MKPIPFSGLFSGLFSGVFSLAVLLALGASSVGCLHDSAERQLRDMQEEVTHIA